MVMPALALNEQDVIASHAIGTSKPLFSPCANLEAGRCALPEPRAP